MKCVGDYKKGNVKGTLKGDIIRQSVINFLRNGIPPEDTIAEAKDPLDFCFSRKIGGGFKGFWGNTEIQKVNRFIPAKKEYGQQLYYMKEDGSTAQVSNGECVVLVNDLTSDFDMQQINLKFFQNKAEELLTKFSIPLKAVEFKDKNATNILKLREMGLFPIPKNFKHNIKGALRRDVRLDWDFSLHPTVGVYTGSKLNLISIDVDVLNKVPADIVEALLSSNSLISWSDKIQSNEDFHINRHKKFKVFFKYSGKELNEFPLLEKYGFEIIYGGIANISGAYDYKDKEYKYKGTLKDLPEILKNRLIMIIERHKKAVEIGIDEVISNPEIKALNPQDYVKLIKEFLNEQKLSYTITEPNETQAEFIHENCNQIFITKCPFAHEHTNAGDAMDIYVSKQGKIVLHCWHSSCKLSLLNLQNELNKKVKTLAENELKGDIKSKLKLNMGREALAKLYE